MSYPRTIRNYNAFVDGVSYFGRVSKGKMPALKLKTSAHRGSGMDAEYAVDMGMEAMQAELTFDEYTTAIIKMFGTKQRITYRPAAMGEDDFEADPYIFTCGGRISSTEFDELGGGNDSKMPVMMDVDFYQIELNGEVLVKIDVENGVRVIGGQDQMASLRAAMGL